MGFVGDYVRFLARRGKLVISAVLLVWAGLAVFAMKLPSTTSSSFSASPGTRSYSETKDLTAVFPAIFDDRETAFIQCEAPADCSCTSSTACSGFRSILDQLVGGLGSSATDGTLTSTTSYFDYGGRLAPLGFAFYNASASAMIVSFQFNKAGGVQQENKVNMAMTKALATARDISKDGWTVQFTGQVATTLSSTKEIGPIIGASDGTGCIFIVLLFGWQVRSWRLCWIPVLNTIICLLMAQGLIYPLSHSGLITLPSYVPNVCLFLSIALSVDYSFFHLSRFQEMRKEGMELQASVVEMVTSAGRVVLVSGVVLMFCWLALAAFPVFGTDTLGYCSAITIFCCITVNIIMNPVMILTFPKFFGKTSQDPWHCCRRRAESAGTPLVAREVHSTNNCYGAVARVATTMPGMILLPLLVYAVLLPGVLRLFSANYVVGGVAGQTKSTDLAMGHILADFPGSQGNIPLTVMLSAPPGVLVKSEEFFQAGADLVKSLQAETGFDGSSFHGVMINSGGPGETFLSWSAAEVLLADSEGIYAWSWRNFVNAENSSILLSAAPPYNAFSNEAKALVDQARKAVSNFQEMPGRQDYRVATFHPMFIEVDAERLTIGRYPLVVTLTLLVVFAVIGLRYKAALIPFKLLLTIAVPIMSTLGMGVFVFQDGILNWTGIPSLQSDGGLVWINPVACTFMLIGFGLDYDIFLFSRIYATRKSGEFMDDRDAIINGVSATGPVISTAGCIMALAFIGMVVQHGNEFLCQMGFTMIFGVLVDTFVVRTLLVPAFLAMAGPWNWWPGTMPRGEAARTVEVNMGQL